MRHRSYLARVMILGAAALALSQFVVGAVPRADAATATFGNVVVGSAADSPGDGYKFGSVHALPEGGTAVSFSFYARGGQLPQRMTPVVYRVQSGNPTTLVARGAEVLIAANQPAGWITSSLPAVALAPGDYLLGLLSGPQGTQARLHYTPAADRGIWNANPSGTPTTNWGQVNRDEASWSVYVTYTPSGSTPTPAPANTSPPTISGSPQQGATLTASTGAWSGNPTSYAYQWRRCQANTCSDVASATASSYIVAGADVGSSLRVVVTAANSAGSASSTSQPTATVTAAPASGSGSFGYSVPGARTDAAGEGYKFGSVHHLDRAATLTSFKWYVRGGGQSQSFVPLVYSASGAGAPGALVVKGQPVTVAAGRAAGWLTAPLPQVTLSPGNYLLGLLSGPSGEGAINFYDTGAADAAWWNRNAYPTPTQEWGALANSAQRWSFYVEYQTEGQAPAAPVNQTAPTISGSAVVGQTLTSSTGTWTNNPTGHAYQWLRCQGVDCTPIPGATSSTYVAVAADEGRSLKVTVTASNSGGSGQATSAPTATVTAPGGGGPPPPFTKITIDSNPIGSVIEKALADIDGNGKLDAVIGMQESPTQGGTGGIFWYRFPASGKATDPWSRHTILPSGTAYEDMASLDVDRDGRVDIVASVNTRVYWYRNPGTLTGAWQQTLIGPGHGENNIVIGDVDADGKPDVVTNSIIYFQNTPSSWTGLTYNDTYNAVALLDIGSGLGRIDIVGNQPTPPYDISWFENPRERGGNARTGSWVRRSVGRGYSCPGGAAECETVATVETADLNRDGRMDVVVGQAEGDPPPPGGLKWFAAPVDRKQAWGERTIDAGFESTHNVTVADMDRNGTPDVVAGEQDQSPQKRIGVFYNDGSGNFTRQIVSTDGSHDVALGDADGDGDVDVLAGLHGWWGAPHPLQLYLNSG